MAECERINLAGATLEDMSALVAEVGERPFRARQLFDGRPVATFQSKYEAESRYLTIGMLDQQLVTVVWTWRESFIRLISARRASNEERWRYRQLHVRSTQRNAGAWRGSHGLGACQIAHR